MLRHLTAEVSLRAQNGMQESAGTWVTAAAGNGLSDNRPQARSSKVGELPARSLAGLRLPVVAPSSLPSSKAFLRPWSIRPLVRRVVSF
jgi:hypothetical protein